MPNPHNPIQITQYCIQLRQQSKQTYQVLKGSRKHSLSFLLTSKVCVQSNSMVFRFSWQKLTYLLQCLFVCLACKLHFCCVTFTKQFFHLQTSYMKHHPYNKLKLNKTKIHVFRSMQGNIHYTKISISMPQLVKTDAWRKLRVSTGQGPVRL